jgi:hypothetical protein
MRWERLFGYVGVVVIVRGIKMGEEKSAKN